MTDTSKIESASSRPVSRNVKAKEAKKRSEELKEQIEQIHTWVAAEVLSIRAELKDKISELKLTIDNLRYELKQPQAPPQKVSPKRERAKRPVTPLRTILAEAS